MRSSVLCSYPLKYSHRKSFFVKGEPGLQKLLGLVRRCVEDYEMIAPGERVAVGVSGGKDSLALLTLLAGLRRFYPFALEAVTIDLGLGMDCAPLAAWCERLEIPYTRVETQIGPVIFEGRREKNPCSLCAKMRRGALNEAILDRGIRKLALGHHCDDAVETFLMCLLFEGRLSCFQPVTELDRSGVTQIRPLLYLREQTLTHFAGHMALPVVENPCPADKYTKRQEIKELVRRLTGEYPQLKTRVFGAMQRLPLPGWGPVRHPRRPLPDLTQD